MMGIISILGLLLAGCRCGQPPLPKTHAAASPRHVVLISMDTVRADALGVYGGHAKTPNIDALASSGVMFANHMSTAPSTLVSHTSLMTGKYPHKHGVPRNAYRLHDANVMLAELLDAAGFETGAILGAMPLGEHANFVQGFHYVDADFRRARESEVYEQAERSGAEVTDAALSWVDSALDERLFLFVHYFDAHQPYESTDDKTSGSMKSVYDLRYQLMDGEPHAKETSAALELLYWSEIGFVDQQLGRLVDGLKNRGVLDDALIILTADHGESYAEHGEYWDHGERVYDQTVHTPLIVTSPAIQARQVDTVVSAVDVVPTVLEILKLPPWPVDGRSLLPLIEGGELPEKAVFSEATKPWEEAGSWQNANRQKAARLGDFKLVWDPASGERSLYNVAIDPAETTDLSASEEFQPLIAAMDGWMAEADPLSSYRVLAPDITEQLKALGYQE